MRYGWEYDLIERAFVVIQSNAGPYCMKNGIQYDTTGRPREDLGDVEYYYWFDAWKSINNITKLSIINK